MKSQTSNLLLISAEEISTRKNLADIFEKEKIFCENIKLDEDLFIGGNKEDIREFNCVICLQIVDLPIACNKCVLPSPTPP